MCRKISLSDGPEISAKRPKISHEIRQSTIEQLQRDRNIRQRGTVRGSRQKS